MFTVRAMKECFGAVLLVSDVMAACPYVEMSMQDRGRRTDGERLQAVGLETCFRENMPVASGMKRERGCSLFFRDVFCILGPEWQREEQRL